MGEQKGRGTKGKSTTGEQVKMKIENKKSGYHQAKHEAASTVNRGGPLVKTLLSGEDIYAKRSSPHND